MHTTWPCHMLQWCIHHSIMMNITWRRFDQSVKWLAVGHTTKNQLLPTTNYQETVLYSRSNRGHVRSTCDALRRPCSRLTSAFSAWMLCTRFSATSLLLLPLPPSTIIAWELRGDDGPDTGWSSFCCSILHTPVHTRFSRTRTKLSLRKGIMPPDMCRRLLSRAKLGPGLDSKICTC